MKCIAVGVLLSLLSLGRSAPVSDCDTLVKPIAISREYMLGRWLYIGGSSDLPGSRSLGHLMSSAWVHLNETSQSNILTLTQTHRLYSKCSSLVYNVTFENSIMLIEQPFYLKEVYLMTEPDCLLAYEEIVSGSDTFTSLLLFSRTKSISPATLEMLKKQAECLGMTAPIIIDPNYEMCPDNIQASEGISALNSLLEAKMGHRVARILDYLFDMFVN